MDRLATDILHEDVSVEELKAWREQRLLLSEVLKKGEVVTSKGKWFAKDKGEGVCTMGVFNCVCVATPELVAHIAADREIPTDSDFKKFCEALQEEKVKHVELFGMRDQLLEDAEKELSSNGITYSEHFNDNNSKAFVVVVRDGKVTYFLD